MNRPRLDIRKADTDAFLSEDGDVDFGETYETAELEFSLAECERTLSKIYDEVERYERENIPIDGVVVPALAYARLYVLTYVDLPRNTTPTKAEVERRVGTDLYIVGRGIISAVPEDPHRLLTGHAFDELPLGDGDNER